MALRFCSASVIAWREVTASISAISPIRRVTRLALCSLGEAEPANITSASTKTRGLLLVGTGLRVITLALLSEPLE